MSSNGQLIQMRLDFDVQPQLVAANDIFQQATQDILFRFKEDRRVERMGLKEQGILDDKRNPALDRDPGARFFLKTLPER
jgi:hypothetical protein